MKKYLYIAMAAMLLCAGCGKEEPVDVPEEGVTALAASVPASTDEVSVLWKDGDRIIVNGVGSEALKLASPVAEAEFRIPSELEAPYKALFPVSAFKDAETITLPSVQKHEAAPFEENVVPMAAYSADSKSLVFNHLCAFVRLELTKAQDVDEILYVEFKGNDDEQVCGDFAVNYQTGTLSGASTALSSRKVRCNVHEEISSDGLAVYMIAPAADYQKGYTLKVVDVSGHYMAVKKEGAQTLKAGKVHDIPSVAFEPTGTEFDMGIATAAEFCDFVSRYNAGSIDGNVVVSILDDMEFTSQDCANYKPFNEFKGTLKGGYHKISGFDTGKPIARETTSEALIENLTVEGKAVVKASNAKWLATFVQNCSGAVVNCHNKVDYTISGTQANWYIIGGVVGQTAGGTARIQDCTSAGNIEVAADFVFRHQQKQKMLIGGIAGIMNTSGDVVENCSASGNLTMQGSLSNGYFYLGGIVGSVLHGTVRNCASDAVLIVSQECQAEIPQYVGGVIGTVDGSDGVIENCVNRADIMCNDPQGQQISFVGGLTGVNHGTVSSSVNKGNLTYRSNIALRTVGGLIGQNNATVINSVNAGNIIVGGCGHHNEIGGLIGRNESSDLTNLANDGNVTLEMLDHASADAFLKMGGCIGYTTESVNGCGMIRNNGGVMWRCADGLTGDNDYAIGGVVGMTDADIKACVNNGHIIFADASSGSGVKNVHVGGVAGYLPKGISLVNCNMSGTVECRQETGTWEYADNAVSCGGIVGFADGVSGSRVKITACNVKNGNGPAGIRTCGGNAGGIAGRVRYGEIASCGCNVESEGSNEVFGGLCGVMEYTNVYECDVQVKHTSSSTVCAGGLVGRLNGSSVLDDCIVSGSLNCTGSDAVMGVFAGEAVSSGSQIRNCLYSVKLNDGEGTVMVGTNQSKVTLKNNASYSADEPGNSGNTLTVMSYNIRYDSGSDGSNSWTNRRKATIAMIDELKPDVFGVQEALSHQVDYVAENTSGYRNVGVGRDDGVEKGEFMSIFYNSHTVELIRWGTFWLSETPDVPSFGWDADCRRTATWALMTDRRNGKAFYFVNTHLDHVGRLAQKNGLQLILDRIADINPDGYPMVLTGDFNVFPDDDCLVELDKQMTSTRKIAEITDDYTTWHDWGRYAPEDHHVIDYIYVRGFSSVPEYRTVNTTFADIPYISDHYPILSVLEY